LKPYDRSAKSNHKVMAKGKKAPKEIPFERMRGVVSFDTNEILLFVPAPVEDVADAFKKLRKLKTWIKDARGKTIVVSEPSYVVYRLKGHKWTIIDSYKANGPDVNDAMALSETFKSRVIHYGNSDTASATGYDLFENGKRLEHFMCYEDLEFESKLRDVEPPEDGPDIYPFVDQFMKEQDAFAPSWTTYFGAFCHKPGAKIKLQILPQEMVERLDYLAA
jgi:hypothetical protein